MGFPLMGVDGDVGLDVVDTLAVQAGMVVVPVRRIARSMVRP